MLKIVLSVAAIATIVMLLAVIRRPALVRRVGGRPRAGGRMLAFLCLFILPVLLMAGGTSQHFEQSKSTEFCLSCHVMEPYGKSLYLVADDPHVPASHFQNRRIPRDQACFTCHTTYAMYGDVKAKLNGLKHLWVNYFGEIPEKIALYEPYNNRECLHCHEGARSYEEHSVHVDVMGEIRSGELSCLECHEFSHDVANIESHRFWTPGGKKDAAAGEDGEEDK